MNIDEKQLLHQWIHQQSEFNKNDLLVAVDPQKSSVFQSTAPLNDWEKTIALAASTIKESGVNPLCTAKGLLTWEFNKQIIQTPLWLLPTQFEVDKVRAQVQFFADDENGFVNPFLRKKMEELYTICLDETSFETVVATLQNAGFQQVDVAFSTLGNFHHHRYVLLKELQDVASCSSFSSPLQQLLSGEKNYRKTIQFSHQTLLPYDTDHRLVMQMLETENGVVQGPPGTGKSQLLTNIIGKTLLNLQTALMVSEKKAALDVVKKRLDASGVGVIAVVNTDEQTTHQFLEEIKTTWEFFEYFKSNKKKSVSVTKELEDNLQLVLDILNQPQLIGGVSYQEFHALQQQWLGVLQSTESQPYIVTVTNNFIGQPPSLVACNRHFEVVEKLYAQHIAKSLALLTPSFVQHHELAEVNTKINRLRQALQALEPIQHTISLQDIDRLSFQCVVYQLFENELAKKYRPLLEPNSKAQKQFLVAYKKYKQFSKQLHAYNTIKNDWKLLPSALQLNHLLELSAEKSFFKKLQFKKQWQRLNHLPLTNASTSIQQLIDCYKIESEIQQVEAKFIDLGIFDCSEIDQLKASLALFTQDKWEVYRQLKTIDDALITNADAPISLLKNEAKTNFNFDNNQPVAEQLEELQKSLPHLMVLQQEIKQLPAAYFDCIAQSAQFSDFIQLIFHSHQVLFQAQYASFSSFSGEELKQRVEQLLTEQANEHQLVAQTILQQVKQQLDEYSKLLNTPAQRLTAEEKMLKQQLKKGKALLVKEFAKSRQHPTMRELLQSEANLWIKALKPVWLTNPTSLAKAFPLQTNLFDMCIVDEASQMPVQNGLGALHRCQYAIIAGDEQQMSPTNYFQAGAQEVVSLLHHASYYFANHTLTHHYRSKHAQLIAFSNEHFYNNQLLAYPSYPVDNNCIQRYFCQQGRFVNRKNEHEANKVVELLDKHLPTNKTIGVVAFSAEQIDAIFKAIPQNKLALVQQKIDENTLFFKPLEKVQGDECEVLIISLGYAPNEEGQFSWHFGPLNTQSGRNRLNVLLTRASEKIEFVCSIEAQSVQWSDNESIQLLYKWLYQLENLPNASTLEFPQNLEPQISGNQLNITHSFAKLKHALELTTTYAVLSKRGWNVNF